MKESPCIACEGFCCVAALAIGTKPTDFILSRDFEVNQEKIDQDLATLEDRIVGEIDFYAKEFFLEGLFFGRRWLLELSNTFRRLVMTKIKIEIDLPEKPNTALIIYEAYFSCPVFDGIECRDYENRPQICRGTNCDAVVPPEEKPSLIKANMMAQRKALGLEQDGFHPDLNMAMKALRKRLSDVWETEG